MNFTYALTAARVTHICFDFDDRIRNRYICDKSQSLFCVPLVRFLRIKYYRRIG